jgi:hypothetical protein
MDIIRNVYNLLTPFSVPLASVVRFETWEQNLARF